VLPEERRKVLRDFAQEGVEQTKVLAAVVRLLETSLIRVGNEEYAREIARSADDERTSTWKFPERVCAFSFAGKSGKEHSRRFARPPPGSDCEACQDIPGQELFQYLNEEGQRSKSTRRM